MQVAHKPSVNAYIDGRFWPNAEIRQTAPADRNQSVYSGQAGRPSVVQRLRSVMTHAELNISAPIRSFGREKRGAERVQSMATSGSDRKVDLRRLAEAAFVIAPCRVDAMCRTHDSQAELRSHSAMLKNRTHSCDAWKG
jgi:hypothetical protein